MLRYTELNDEKKVIGMNLQNIKYYIISRAN